VATVGQAISGARKELGISQKELASRIKKEDGSPISPQYLNDIERDRRNPPAPYLLDRFSEELGLPHDYLHFLARQLPEDIDPGDYGPDRVESAFRAFRKALRARPGDER
jgi:transcriptional regulator with XRE-family HTH domain